MCISEHEDEIIIELESQDATFLEDDLPCASDIDRDLYLYEIIDPDIRSIPEQQLMFESSESELVLVVSKLREPMLKKSSW